MPFRAPPNRSERIILLFLLCGNKKLKSFIGKQLCALHINKNFKVLLKKQLKVRRLACQPGKENV
jgi:hypothetical protein